MAGLINCQLHQTLGYINTRLGVGMGCCQMDGDYTACRGDVDYCEKPHLLIQHVVKNIKKPITTVDRLSPHVTFVSFKDSLDSSKR